MILYCDNLFAICNCNAKYYFANYYTIKVSRCYYRLIEMDWLGLGKYTFTFGSTAFDIGSDITNSLNFLGVFNKDTYTNTTLRPSNYLTYLNATDSTMPLCATQKITDCAAMDQRQDLIWGILSLSIIFLPGAVGAIGEIKNQRQLQYWRLGYNQF